MKKDSRNLLLDAALVVFSKNPGAPMGEVADAAGLGRATLYRHFPSRDDLIRELTLKSYRQMDEALAPIVEESLTGVKLLKGLLEALIPFGDLYYFLLLERTFDQDPEIQALSRQDEQAWAELMDHLKEEGVVAVEVPTSWAISVVESLIYTAWSSVREGHIASREAPDLVFHTILSGLGPRI